MAKAVGEINGKCLGWGCMAYSPKGRFLVTGGGPTYLFDMTPGERGIEQQLVGNKFPIECMSYSPDGKRAAAACGKDKRVLVWEIPKEYRE
jgi:WD40 repeat protein